jgi:hypothetical protein
VRGGEAIMTDWGPLAGMIFILLFAALMFKS